MWLKRKAVVSPVRVKKIVIQYVYKSQLCPLTKTLTVLLILRKTCRVRRDPTKEAIKTTKLTYTIINKNLLLPLSKPSGLEVEHSSARQIFGAPILTSKQFNKRTEAKKWDILAVSKTSASVSASADAAFKESCLYNVTTKKT